MCWDVVGLHLLKKFYESKKQKQNQKPQCEVRGVIRLIWSHLTSVWWHHNGKPHRPCDVMNPYGQTDRQTRTSSCKIYVMLQSAHVQYVHAYTENRADCSFSHPLTDIEVIILEAMSSACLHDMDVKVIHSHWFRKTGALPDEDLNVETLQCVALKAYRGGQNLFVNIDNMPSSGPLCLYNPQ